MKSFITIMIFAILFIPVATKSAYASSGNVAGNSAALAHTTAKREDFRVKKLKEYLTERNSPLAPYAETFIHEADVNSLDWRLVVSISGFESGYGKHIPVGSYNGWGWGYRNGTVMHFSSWDEAIKTISHDLREKYLDRGVTNVDAIGSIYAASPTWAVRVKSFMNKLENFQPKAASLPISI